VTCHVREGTILTSKPTASIGVPHPLSYSPRLNTSEYCGGCHQFDIHTPQTHPFEGVGGRFSLASPKGAGRTRLIVTRASQTITQDRSATDPDEPPIPTQPGIEQEYQEEPRAQHTLDEFRLSAAAARGESCQSCHMPAGQGGAGHNWPGRNSTRMLQKAVTLTARLDKAAYRTGETLQAVIKLKNDAGHRFPTGDSVHAGILDVWLKDGDRTLGREVFVMAQGTEGRRIFEALRPHGRVRGRRAGAPTLEAPERDDTRLLPGEEATLVFRQEVDGRLADAAEPVLRVRVFHSAIHPGFRNTRIDPKLSPMRLIREEVLRVKVTASGVARR